MSATPTMTDEERAERIAERREARRVKRLSDAVRRVSIFTTWVQADSEITTKRRAAEAAGDPLPKRIPMPEVPSDTDYALVRENEEA